ncbi:MAG: hypothetical protein QG636_741 [Patescibacteria group bacterium]|nr:hypothetical protein [Patescibacteria group bacterium]
MKIQNAILILLTKLLTGEKSWHDFDNEWHLIYNLNSFDVETVETAELGQIPSIIGRTADPTPTDVPINTYFSLTQCKNEIEKFLAKTQEKSNVWNKYIDTDENSSREYENFIKSLLPSDETDEVLQVLKKLWHKTEQY